VLQVSDQYRRAWLLSSSSSYARNTVETIFWQPRQGQ
jgi:hypothetical protein